VFLSAFNEKSIKRVKALQFKLNKYENNIQSGIAGLGNVGGL